MNRQELDQLRAVNDQLTDAMGKVYALYAGSTNRPQALLGVNKKLNTARNAISKVLIDEWQPS